MTTPPGPATIRRWGLLILFSLAAPKIFWDLQRLRSYSVKDSQPDGPTDPALRVLRLALSKALSEQQRCWDQVLMPYCTEEIVDITRLVLHFNKEAKALVEQLAVEDGEYERKQQKKRDENKHKSKDDDDDKNNSGGGGGGDEGDDEGGDVDGSTPTDKNITKDADAEDGFLEQWCDTLHKTINAPLYEAFKIKEDDASAEKEVRAMVRVMIFVGEAMITALKTRRRRNALKKFISSKQDHESDVDNEKLRDENNRSRAKLELFINSSRNQEYAYFLSDKYLQSALDKHGKTYTTITLLDNVKLAPSEWHIECWSDWDTKESWSRYRVQWLPEEWWSDLILPQYTKFAVQARLVDINIEHELGSIKTQRFYKLVNFINRDMCGQWHQRVLIVLAWIIGAAKTIVDTTEWHYRSSLLIQSIEMTLKRRRGGDDGGGMLSGGRGASLMDVCISIVVMKSSSALLADLLDKVKEAGQGSIRRSLVHKVTHHILSQDLQDAVNRDGESDKHHQLIASLSSSRNWDHSLGSVLLIPQDLISQLTMIISSASLMWSKSPTLLFAVGVAIFFKEYCEKVVRRGEFFLQRSIGLDKHQWKGWYEMHSIRTALR